MAGLKDKVVLVTGASSGIGKGTAIHMAGIGCKLALVARYKIKNNPNRELIKIAGSIDITSSIPSKLRPAV